MASSSRHCPWRCPVSLGGMIRNKEEGIEKMNEPGKILRQLGTGRMLAWLAFGAAFLVSYLPVLLSLVRTWYQSEDFSHGFMIIPLAGYMVWRQREEIAASPVQSSWSGLPLAACSLLAYLFAQLSGMATLASLSVVTFLWGGVIYLFGFSIFRVCLFPLLFLLFMIPVPAQVYAALTIPLQLLVTKISVGMASFMGIPIYREGNVIFLPDMTFQVVQACSGLRSIMTMLTLGAVMGYFFLRSPLLSGILMLAGIPVAIVVNIFRVVSIVVAYYLFKLDLVDGASHTMLGIVVFVAAIGMFLLLQKGLSRWEK